MGVVYKAFDPNIRRTVAIKTIRKDLVEDERADSMLARFKNEAQAAGRLSHPGHRRDLRVRRRPRRRLHRDGVRRGQ